MHEIVVTRHNELIDPVLQVWNWQIPVYLFLGGWVAGMMVITGYFLLTRGDRKRPSVCSVLPPLGLVVLSLGMFALFLDLEHKAYVWRLYTTFQWASPMSWGAWILVAVYPALLASWLVSAPALLRDLWPALNRFHAIVVRDERLVTAIGGAAILLGAMLGIYTGVLLSSLGARPFWNSALLGPLFLVSGLSSAAAFTHLVARNPDQRALLASADNSFLAIEFVLVVLFLIGLLNASQAHIEAARLVLGGPLTAVFWVGVVALGIVIPLGIQLMTFRGRVAHTPIAPLLVMGGGLALRFVFVYAGQLSRWPV